MRIFTIGYESTTVAEFIGALQSAGVKRVIDVRAVPNSRRPGFSKTPLRNALAEEGIDYVHLRALGTPADGRAAAWRGVTMISRGSTPDNSNCLRRSRKAHRWSTWRRSSRAHCSAMSESRLAATAHYCLVRSLPKRR